MNQTIISFLSQELQIQNWQVANTVQLFSESCTLPFVARYRKEKTGGLDEVQLQELHTRIQYYDTLEKRKETILKTIAEQELLTPELEKQISTTYDSVVLEDLYLPYKPKKKTRASEARAKGLEPLAQIIYTQQTAPIKDKIQAFAKDKKMSIEDVKQGCLDIVAEWVSENSDVRNDLRKEFAQNAIISTKVVKSKKEEAVKYEQYFEFSEPIKKSASHRLLAMMRGENEGFLRLHIEISEELAISLINRKILKGYSESSALVKDAIIDSYSRLIAPSLEKETYNVLKERADAEAILVFAQNLRQLLLLPPLGQKRILGIDPGFRTGCKLVCINENGDLLHNETIYPHAPQNESSKAMAKISQLVQAYNIQAISIGNGTAGRETEQLIKRMRFTTDIQVFVVNEAGASIYSASKVAREEFPQYDVTVRGSVSIARRLMDPLAELVKIDPKSIGVGQYQHDVNQTQLQTSLDFVVQSCVNMVGVELNTASKHLLQHVSGIGPGMAENIVNYRKENGDFTSRKDILQVPKMGKKTFEQCAGFLRIRNSKHPLDNSSVHPERYALVEKMAKDAKCTIVDLLQDSSKRSIIELHKYESEEVGMPTLHDIMQELEKPGRDPRTKLQTFTFNDSLSKLEDVVEGAIYPGIITNLTNFGAFVDIGIKQNGLIHISQICDKFISNPAEVLQLNQQVQVKVLEVDLDKKRLQLTLKGF